MYGHAAPFYQISRGVRTVVFNTKNEGRSIVLKISLTHTQDIVVGLNFGILFAWIIISCLSLPLFQWYRRREEVRQEQGKRKVPP